MSSPVTVLSSRAATETSDVNIKPIIIFFRGSCPELSNWKYSPLADIGLSDVKKPSLNSEPLLVPFNAIGCPPLIVLVTSPKTVVAGELVV